MGDVHHTCCIQENTEAQKRRTTHLVRNEAGNNLCMSRNVVALFFLSAFWQEGP